VDRIAINPPPALLGKVNAIVGGRARRYEAENVAGPLSIKCVVEGVAAWETASGRFEIGPAGWLVLNDGEEYTITVDSRHPVETFCVFFRRGFVEEAHRSATTPTAALLDAAPPGDALHFAERLHSDSGVRDALMRARHCRGDDFALDAALHSVAAALVRARGDVASRVARLPALRGTTRAEIARRLDRAVAFIHGHLDRPLSIGLMASAACLSPFHFHRLFGSYFGETPHRYVTRLRLERAAALLRGSEREVVEVANACGFSSAGSFSALFARTFGVPPARFRKNGETAAGAAGYHRRP
jgi:AraC-like DNA-binding protein